MMAADADQQAVNMTVIGDYFVRSTLLEEALTRQLTPLGLLPLFTTAEVDWPTQPLIHNAEVAEYVGDPAQVAELARDADVLVTHVAPVTEAVLAASPTLRVVACCRGGPVNVNVAAATACGIPVINAPARNSQAVVEFTLGLILAECRGIGRAHAALVAESGRATSIATIRPVASCAGRPLDWSALAQLLRRSSPISNPSAYRSWPTTRL